MPAFHALGFRWNLNGFNMSPHDFFSREAYYAIFVNSWALKHIHTPRQAAILLRAFLEASTSSTYDSSDLVAGLDWEHWIPCADVSKAIHALRPREKVFPVSGNLRLHVPRPTLKEYNPIINE